jgi:hypothetical protein
VHLSLGTRATVWPIVALASLALAVPAHAGPPGEPPGKANANAKGKGKSKGQRGRSQGAPRGQSQGAPRGRSQGAPRGHSQGAPHGRARGQSKPRPPATPARTRSDGASASPSRSAPSGRKAGKVTICHATGSDTNPYVEITISANALKAHRAHQHGEDLLEVPAGGCRGAKAAGKPAGTSPAAAQPVAGLADRAADSPASPPAVSGVGGVTAEGGERPPAAAQPAGARDGDADPARAGERSERDSLPFTGLALLTLVALGAASLAVGTRIRRST